MAASEWSYDDTPFWLDGITRPPSSGIPHLMNLNLNLKFPSQPVTSPGQPKHNETSQSQKQIPTPENKLTHVLSELPAWAILPQTTSLQANLAIVPLLRVDLLL